jgi:hypothetical protein
MNEYAYAAFASQKPGPISIGDVLDRLWRTLRSHWKLYLGLGTLPAAGGILWMALIFTGLFATGVLPLQPGVPPDSARMMPWIFGAFWVGAIPNLLIFALYQAAAAFTALKEARGQQATIREAYSAARSKAGRFCWLMILQYLCIALPVLLCEGLLMGVIWVLQSGHQSPSPATFVAFPLIFLFFLGAMVYAIWMFLYLGMAFPASVAEDLPAVAALKRSAQLSYKAKGKLFLVLLIIYAISYAAIFVVEIGGGIVLAVGALLLRALHLNTTVEIAAASVFGLAFLVLILAFTTLLWAAYMLNFTIVYCDQRLRLDGQGPESAPVAGGIVPA